MRKIMRMTELFYACVYKYFFVIIKYSACGANTFGRGGVFCYEREMRKAVPTRRDWVLYPVHSKDEARLYDVIGC